MPTHQPTLLILATATTLGLAATSANAATTISEDFETSSGGTPPSGWTFLAPGTSGTPTYGTTTGYDGGTLGGQITSNTVDGAFVRLPGGYIVNSGSTAFDATQTITGSFGFRIDATGFYGAASFMMGDIQSGFTATDPGQLVGASIGYNTFGERGYIVDGAANEPERGINFSNNSNWYQVEFSWTPTTGTTGNFSYTVKNTGGGTIGTLTTSTPVTLDSANVYFGFGANQPAAYGPAAVTFDNISITGTEIPEPGSLALLAAGGLLIARRRRG